MKNRKGVSNDDDDDDDGNDDDDDDMRIVCFVSTF